MLRRGDLLPSFLFIIVVEGLRSFLIKKLQFMYSFDAGIEGKEISQLPHSLDIILLYVCKLVVKW